MENNSRNPYAPPEARLEKGPAAPDGASGSLEAAVAGDYELTIGGVMSEAWHLVPGFKGTFWGGLGLSYLVVILASIVLAVVFGVVAVLLAGGDPRAAAEATSTNIWLPILNALVSLALSPLYVGVLILAVRRACGMPVSCSMVFDGLRKAPVLIGGMVLVVLLVYLGLLLLVLPGMYLGLAYGMTLPLLVFNNIGIWRAMETSRRALTHRWFSLFAIYFVVSWAVALSALLLLVPLIWTIPWAVLVFGVVYRRVFGTPPEAPA